MKKAARSLKPVQMLTGKYGILLLTVLNVCLACLVITLSDYWSSLDILHGNTDFMTFFVLFCFLQAVLAGKALRTSDYATLLLSYLFFLNKIFWWNNVQEIGMLDVFMTLLVQVYLLTVERRRTLGYILAPVVCFAGLLIHTSFFFYGFPIVAAILWLELLKAGKPGRVCVAAFALACAVSVTLFALFTIFPQDLVRVSPDELDMLLRQKYAGDIQDKYFIYHLYRTDAVKNNDTIDAFDFLSAASVSRDVFSAKMRRHLLNLLLVSAPFICGCVLHARRSGNRLTAYLGCIAPLVALVPSLLFSTDTERFFSLCILAQYMLLHYLSTQTDVHFLPASSDPPVKELNAYAAGQRKKKDRSDAGRLRDRRSGFYDCRRSEAVRAQAPHDSE